MSVVYVVVAEYGPDFPSMGGWKIDSVWSNLGLANKRLEELLLDPVVKFSSLNRFEVKGSGK